MATKPTLKDVHKSPAARIVWEDSMLQAYIEQFVTGRTLSQQYHYEKLRQRVAKVNEIARIKDKMYKESVARLMERMERMRLEEQNNPKPPRPKTKKEKLYEKAKKRL